MRLGILTFHRSHNYGTVLQVYSFQEYLRSKGHDVYIIDYIIPKFARWYPRDGIKIWISKNPRKALNRLLNYIKTRDKRHNRWDNFDNFFKTKYNIRPTCQGDEYVDLDALFLGSDQIWSASHTEGVFDAIYFGKNSSTKVISYAPSTSIEELNGE